MTDINASTLVAQNSSTAKKVKLYSANVRDEWTYASAVTDEYYDFLQEVDCLQILTRAEAKSKLKTKRVLDGEYFWAVQGIDPATNEPGMLKVKTGGSPKYLTPSGSSPDAVFLPLIDGESWRATLEREKRVVITEGEKKAACIYSLTGIPAISLTGVTNWLPESSKGSQRPFMGWAWNTCKELGVEVLIAFDMDAHTNENVKREVVKLKHYCDEQGIPNRVLEWEWNEKYKGIDDYIASIDSEECQKKELLAVLQSNLDISKWEKQFEKPEKEKTPSPRELGDSIAEIYRSKWKFDLEKNNWYVWGEKYWQARKEQVIQKAVRDEALARGIQYKSEKYTKDVLETVKLECLVDEWQQIDRTRYIAADNGILDMETGEVEGHYPGSGIKSVLPHKVYSFQKLSTVSEVLNLLEENCPEVHNFFHIAMGGDKAKILSLIALAAGILRFRMSKLQRYAHLIGDPGTGKGTYLRFLEDVVGETNSQSASAANLSDRNVLARIIDAQLVQFPDERRQANIEAILKLSGQDSIDYRENYTVGGSKRFLGSLVIASNSFIYVGDTTGIKRRIWIIPFENKPKRANSNLREILKAEVPEFIKVCLSLPLPLLDDIIEGRGEGEMHDAKYHAWKMAVDGCNVAQFIDENLIPDTERLENSSVLFESFTNWAKRQNISSPGSQKHFSGRLLLHFSNLPFWYKKDKISVSVWKGYRLRGEFEFAPPTIAEMLKGEPQSSLTGGSEDIREDTREDSNLDVARLREDREDNSLPLREKNNQEVRENLTLPTEKNEKDEGETLPKLPKLDTASASILPAKLPREDSTLPSQEYEQACWERFNSKLPYPNPKSDNDRASQKRVSKIRDAVRAAQSKEDLSALRRDNGGEYSSDELLWTQNFLKNFFKDEYRHLMEVKNISQPTIPGLES